MVVCFLGDSLVQGIGDARALGWPGRLAEACFAREPKSAVALTLYNLGLRGDSAPRIAARWRAEAERRMRPGEDLALVFSFGTADGHQHLPREESLAAAREIFAAAPGLGRCLYIAPPPVADPEWAAHSRALGRRLMDLAKGCGMGVFDLFGPLADSRDYAASLAASDRIHPDAAGYDQMARLLSGWAPMRELLGL